MSDSLMLTVAEAAELLGISAPTAYRLIDRGEFPVPVRKLGQRFRISRVQLERWAAGDEPPAPANLRSIGGNA
jgi:excisionase family DNA binding protein